MHRRLLCCFTFLDRRNPEVILVFDIQKKMLDPNACLQGRTMLSLLRHCYVMQAGLRCAPMQTTDRKHSALLLNRARCIGQI